MPEWSGKNISYRAYKAAQDAAKSAYNIDMLDERVTSFQPIFEAAGLRAENHLLDKSESLLNQAISDYERS